jgi:hypothetical protein
MNLLIVINEKDDLVYKHIFSTKTDSKLYMDLLMVSYGSIDTLKIIMKSSSSSYYNCIDTYKNYRISAIVFPSYYRCLYVHRHTKNVKKFMHEVYNLFRNLLIYDIVDYDKEIEGAEEEVEKIYCKYYDKQ